MTPQEIARHLHESPALHAAMQTDKPRVWHFLRRDVATCIHMADAYFVPTMTVIGRVLVLQPHTVPCEKCKRPYAHDMLLESPYNGPLPAGWCMECILHEFLYGLPITDKYRDPRSREYDAKYDAQCKAWDDINDVYCPTDDNPPIRIV